MHTVPNLVIRKVVSHMRLLLNVEFTDRNATTTAYLFISYYIFYEKIYVIFSGHVCSFQDGMISKSGNEKNDRKVSHRRSFWYQLSNDEEFATSVSKIAQLLFPGNYKFSKFAQKVLVPKKKVEYGKLLVKESCVDVIIKNLVRRKKTSTMKQVVRKTDLRFVMILETSIDTVMISVHVFRKLICLPGIILVAVLYCAVNVHIVTRVCSFFEMRFNE